MPETSSNPKDIIGRTKPDLSLIPPSSLVYQALAMGNGAQKYGPYNWRDEKVSARVYVAAALRHLVEWLDGEESARDSGVPHLGHALATIGILIDAQETGNLVDDRPKPGAASDLIERYTTKKEPPAEPEADDFGDGRYWVEAIDGSHRTGYRTIAEAVAAATEMAKKFPGLPFHIV